jgi:hypothetical protein
MPAVRRVENRGKFKPEYVGKSQFYCAALDEQVKLAHENPSIGLVLCKTADSAQVRLALTAAARKSGWPPTKPPCRMRN